MEVIVSKGNVPIRLPSERRIHITEEHSEWAGYFYDVRDCVTQPDTAYEGISGEYLAVKEIERGKYLVVVYKELTV